MLQTPLTSADDYIRHFSAQPLPVLRHSTKSLAALRNDEERISGRILAAEVLRDPLLALRLLAYLEAHRAQSRNHDITTIDRGIMMMGVTPFFAHFADLPTVEDRLAGHPKALVGVLRVIARARHAARWARDWALIRHDIDVDEVTVAALLHDAAEILLWCFAPDLAQGIAVLMQKNPGLRSHVAQGEVLGVTMRDLQITLVRSWRLPDLLVSLMDDACADNPRVRSVILACNLARHSAEGWRNPALNDDYVAVCELLHMRMEALLQRVGVPQEFWPEATGDS